MDLSDLAVVQRHLDFVRAQNTDGMSIDYAEGATLLRPDATYVGRSAIAAYFETVRERLGGGVVSFNGPITQADASLVVHWEIDGGPGSGTRGVDTYVVNRGLIEMQTVRLLGADF